MYCSSLSKSLAPGYRIGWAMAGRFAAEVQQLKRIQNICCANVTQAAVAHYLQHGRYDHHLKSLRKALHTQCLRYMQAVINYFPADTKISQPAGGFVLWLELNKNVDAAKLRADAKKHHLTFSPGKIFSASAHFDHCIRLSFGKPWSEEIDAALKLLGGLVKRQLR